MNFAKTKRRATWFFENFHHLFYPILLLCCLWIVIPIFGPQWFYFQVWQYQILFFSLIISYFSFCNHVLRRKNAKNIWHYLFRILQVLLVLPIGYIIFIFVIFETAFSAPSFQTSQFSAVSIGFLETPIRYSVFHKVGFFYNVYLGEFTGLLEDSEYFQYFSDTLRWQNALYSIVSFISLIACLYFAYRVCLFFHRLFIARPNSNEEPVDEQLFP